jgi:hypothetical protein
VLWSVIISNAIAATLLALSATTVHALTCEQFEAAVVEGATEYQLPKPEFTLLDINATDDPDIKYWSIGIFDDTHSMFLCRHGRVRSFLADADDSAITSSLHLAVLMGIGLHAYGMDWRPALDLRDQLARAAKSSRTHAAKLPVDGGEASLIISAAGVPSFAIEAEK